MILNQQNDRRRQRNITNFLRFKKKSTTPNGGSTERKQSELKPTQTKQNTERSSPRTSASSIEVYEKRALHLSKLRSNLKQQKPKQQLAQQPSLKLTNYVTGDLLKNRIQATSHEKKIKKQNSQITQMSKLAQTRRKTPTSANNLLRFANRTPSNHKGTQSSLEKQQSEFQGTQYRRSFSY